MLFGCTKTRSPGIGTVLHWRPPDIHIFGTDPSLVLGSVLGLSISIDHTTELLISTHTTSISISK